LDSSLRYRPQVIIADTPTDPAGCKSRAENEVRRRRGQGRGLTYTVNGWRHDTGLWRPGDLVPVRDRWLGIDDIRLIESVQLVLDDNGERAELRVVPPSAWDLVAEPEKEEDSLWTS
jgi:prophage tail gpP-like protein